MRTTKLVAVSLAVSLALALAGCSTPVVHGSGSPICERAAYWEGSGDDYAGWAPRESYHRALEETFEWNTTLNEPGRGHLVYNRLNELEEFCWKLRLRETEPTQVEPTEPPAGLAPPHEPTEDETTSFNYRVRVGVGGSANDVTSGHDHSHDHSHNH